MNGDSIIVISRERLCQTSACHLQIMFDFGPGHVIKTNGFSLGMKACMMHADQCRLSLTPTLTRFIVTYIHVYWKILSIHLFFLSIYLFIYLSIYVSIFLSIYLSIYLSIGIWHLSIYISIHPSFYPFIRVSIYLPFIYGYLYITTLQI